MTPSPAPMDAVLDKKGTPLRLEPEINRENYKRTMNLKAKNRGYSYLGFCNKIDGISVMDGFNRLTLFEQTIMSQRHLFKMSVPSIAKLNRYSYKNALRLVKRIESKLIALARHSRNNYLNYRLKPFSE